jgi:type 2 lantibiotic biosynthesis protein LanM
MNKVEIEEEVLKYWEQILGREVCNKLNEKENIKAVLAGETYQSLFSIEDSNIWNCYKNNEYRLYNLENPESILDIVFSNFYIPYIKIAEYKFLEKNRSNYILFENKKVILFEFENKLASKLLDCCIRMLIFEMSLLKGEGKLVGNTPEEEYNDYLKRWLMDSEYTNELFEVYPALLRLFLDVIDNTINFYTELLEHYQKDQQEIKDKLHIGTKQFKHLSVGGSDSHNHGKSVAIITYLDDKRVIYKPHDVSTELRYHNFTQWIGKKNNIDMKGYCILDKGNYGWEEWVEHIPCESEADLKYYYRRIGVILCVNYMLNAYDLHNENIIASGAYPIVIDTETILKNYECDNFDSINSYTYNKIRETVVAQGLLPSHIRKGQSISIDVSGMSGEGEQEYPVKLPVIINAKRSDMKCAYQYLKSTPKNNIPFLQDKVIMPTSYLENVLEGFQTIYEYAMSNKELVLEQYKPFKKLILRHLRRNTQTYAMILQTSRHPDFLIDGTSRELFLMTLYKDRNLDEPKEYMAVKDEVIQLLNNDIPMYSYRADGTNLISDYGLNVKNYFDKSAFSLIEKKLQNMNPHDLNQQKLFIVLAITSIDDATMSNYHIDRVGISYILKDIKEKNNLSNIENDLLYEHCKRIAERIEEGAIYSEDRVKVNWIGVSMGGLDEIRWNVAPLSYNLYDGIGGIAIFFHALTKTFQDNRYKFLCNALDATLEEHMNHILLMNKEIVSNSGSGGYSGECSLMYVYLTLFEITKKKIYWENAEKLYAVVQNQISKDIENDIISGNAGAILTLLKMYRLSKEKKYLQLAVEAGQVLVKNGEKHGERVGWTLPGQPYSVSGLSHGFSGIALALFQLGKISGIELFRDIAKEAILEENSMYHEDFGNWADRRVFKGKTGEQVGNNPVTWCHGAAGILLARIKMYPYVDEEFRNIIKIDINRAVNTLKGLGGLKNQCLCHGQIGNLEILSEYEMFEKEIKTEKEANAILHRILQTTKTNWNCGLIKEYEHVGFMLGISGIGYSLLRKINHELPCILSLD